MSELSKLSVEHHYNSSKTCIFHKVRIHKEGQNIFRGELNIEFIAHWFRYTGSLTLWDKLLIAEQVYSELKKCQYWYLAIGYNNIIFQYQIPCSPSWVDRLWGLRYVKWVGGKKLPSGVVAGGLCAVWASGGRPLCTRTYGNGTHRNHNAGYPPRTVGPWPRYRTGGGSSRR